MKPRSKFLIGAGLVLAAAGYLMASSIKSTGMYYLTPTELSTKLTADSSFHDVGMKLGDKWNTDPAMKATFHKFHLGVELVLDRRFNP